MPPKRALPTDPATATAAAKSARRQPAPKNPPAPTPAAASTAAAPKRRGRPPGPAKAKVPAKTQGQATSSAAVQSATQAPPKRRGRPPGSTKAKIAADAKAAADEKAANEKAASKKRPRQDEAPAAPIPIKKLKTEPVINQAPTQRLDVYVMGSGECSELGLGPTVRNGQDPTSAEAPVLNDLVGAKSVGVVQVAVGGMHCAALTQDSRILTWGVNDNGALGRDTTYTPPETGNDANGNNDDDDLGLNPLESTPTAVPENSFAGLSKTFVQVVATSSATFALTAQGRVMGWGQFSGSSGSIGFSKEAADRKIKFQPTPMLIPSLAKITALAAGGEHVLALDDKGKVHAWGCGEQGQLGRRVIERLKTAALTPAGCGLRGRVVSIFGGAYHSFAITEAGDVYAFGLNNFGQTGIAAGAGGSDAVIFKPQRVQSLANLGVDQLAGGNHHSIARTNDNRVFVFGRADDHQMGIDLNNLPAAAVIRDANQAPQALLTPTQVPGLQARDVAAGLDDTLAISTDGAPYGWGFSENFRTGLKTEDSVARPTRIDSAAIKGKKMTFVGCGGQFSVIAGPATE